MFFMHKIGVTQGHPSYKNSADPGNKSEAVLRVIVPDLSVASYSMENDLSPGGRPKEGVFSGLPLE